MEELLAQVRQWGLDRNLNAPENLKAQTFKLVSEFGEIAQGVIANDRAAIADGIGDSLVVTIIIGQQIQRQIVPSDLEGGPYVEDCHFGYPLATLGLMADQVLKNQIDLLQKELGEFVKRLAESARAAGFNPVDCLRGAYAEIKDRKGVMYNGAFIKEADPRYAEVMKELGRA